MKTTQQETRSLVGIGKIAAHHNQSDERKCVNIEISLYGDDYFHLCRYPLVESKYNNNNGYFYTRVCSPVCIRHIRGRLYFVQNVTDLWCLMRRLCCFYLVRFLMEFEYIIQWKSFLIF